jgi:NhaP-type Na+/H+ or K+/H+ antiporter
VFGELGVPEALLLAVILAPSAAVLVAAGRRTAIDPFWIQIVPVAAAALAYTVAVPVGGSGFIAAFVGGLTFGAIRRRAGGEVSHLIEELGDLFNAVTFIVFGAVVLSLALGHLSWQAIVYAVLSLTVVRMVPVALALLGLHPVLRPSRSLAGSGRAGSPPSCSRS